MIFNFRPGGVQPQDLTHGKEMLYANHAWVDNSCIQVNTSPIYRHNVRLVCLKDWQLALMKSLGFVLDTNWSYKLLTID